MILKILKILALKLVTFYLLLIWSSQLLFYLTLLLQSYQTLMMDFLEKVNPCI